MFLSDEQRKAMEAAAERFKSGEVDEIEVEVSDGQTMRILRDPDSPMGMRTLWPEGLGFEMPQIEMYPPSSQRPDDLSEWVPFLSDARIIVTPLPGARNAAMASYIRKGPWEGDIDSLRTQLVEDGWEGGPADGPEDSEKYRAEWEKLSHKDGVDLERLARARAEYDKTPRDHYEYVRDGRRRRLTVMHHDEGSTMSLAESDVVAEEGE